MTETTNPTTTISEAVAALSNFKRNQAIRSANAYGQTSSIAPEYVETIAAQIKAWGEDQTTSLSIAAAGAIRSETEAAGLPTSCYAVSNGKAAASTEAGYPGITGRQENIRYFEVEADAQAVADQLNRTPGIRGGFKVVTL